MVTIGVLALQGDVREHLAAVRTLGADAFGLRRPAELDRCDGLVLPGGESTTMIRLARTFGMLTPLRERLAAGMPAFGTCAGMILLAEEILDGEPGQQSLGGLDVTVRRNAFGRQVDSFETDLAVAGMARPVRAAFIRAPWVERAGPAVEVLASAADHPVAVRQGSVLATAFHPELRESDGEPSAWHRLFLERV